MQKYKLKINYNCGKSKWNHSNPEINPTQHIILVVLILVWRHWNTIFQLPVFLLLEGIWLHGPIHPRVSAKLQREGVWELLPVLQWPPLAAASTEYVITLLNTLMACHWIWFNNLNYIFLSLGLTEDGKKELIFLSNRNPYTFERICASLWAQTEVTLKYQCPK